MTQNYTVIDRDGRVGVASLEAIGRSIADTKPLPEPFNGADRLVLSKDVYDNLLPHMHTAFPFGGPMLSVSGHLPPGHGIGWRRRRPDDEPDILGDDEKCVWFLAPKSTQK